MADHTYDVTIGGDTYTVSSPNELTDAQAYTYAKAQVPFDPAKQNAVMRANMAKQPPGTGERTRLEDFATSGPMGTVLEGLNAGHEGNYARATHKILTGLGEVTAPAAIPALAAGVVAAPLATLGSLAAGAVGGPVGRTAAKTVTDNPDLQDLAGDVGGVAGSVAGGIVGGKANALLRPAIRFAGRVGRQSFSPARRVLGAVADLADTSLSDTAGLPSGAREIDTRGLVERTGDALTHPRETLRALAPQASQTDLTQVFSRSKGIRLAPPGGPPGTPRVPYGGVSDVVSPDVKESGARTLDVGEIAGVKAPPVNTSVGDTRMAIPGSSTGPAPYRASAKAAQRAEAQNGSASTGAPVVDTSGQPVDRAVLKKMGYSEDTIDRIVARQQAPAPGVRLSRPPVAPAEPTDATGRPLGGTTTPVGTVPPVDRRVDGGTSPTGTERRVTSPQRRPVGMSEEDYTALQQRSAQAVAKARISEAKRATDTAAGTRAAQQEAQQGSIRNTPPAKSVPTSGGQPLGGDTLESFLQDQKALIDTLSDPEGRGLDSKRIAAELKSTYPEELSDLSPSELQAKVKRIRTGQSGNASADLIKTLDKHIEDHVSSPADAKQVFDAAHNKPTAQRYYGEVFDRRFPGWRGVS